MKSVLGDIFQIPWFYTAVDEVKEKRQLQVLCIKYRIHDPRVLFLDLREHCR